MARKSNNDYNHKLNSCDTSEDSSEKDQYATNDEEGTEEDNPPYKRFKSNGLPENENPELPWDRQILEANPGMKKTKFNVKLPETDGKFFILKVPQSVNPNFLLSKKIKLDKECNIVINEEDYIMRPEKSKNPLIINIGSSKFISSEDIITVQKSLPSFIPLENLPQANPTSEIKLPKTKKRHPLLGVEYEEKLTLDEDVVNKLEKAEKHKLKGLKKESKKKSKQVYNESLMDIMSINTSKSTSFIAPVQIKNEFDKYKAGNESNLNISKFLTQDRQESNSKTKHKKENKREIEMESFTVDESMSFETYKALKKINNEKKNTGEDSIMVPRPIKLENGNEKKTKKKKEKTQEMNDKSKIETKKGRSKSKGDENVPKPMKEEESITPITSDFSSKKIAKILEFNNGTVENKHKERVPKPIKIETEPVITKSKKNKTKNDLIQESLLLMSQKLKGLTKKENKERTLLK